MADFESLAPIALAVVLLLVLAYFLWRRRKHEGYCSTSEILENRCPDQNDVAFLTESSA
jgi:MYXO-CTERM domain-containing protein